MSYHFSQGPSFLPTGKGSQLAKKNLSNIVAAKTIKVKSGLLILCEIFSVYWTLLISLCSRLPLNPSVVCFQAGIRGMDLRSIVDVQYVSAEIRALM